MIDHRASRGRGLSVADGLDENLVQRLVSIQPIHEVAALAIGELLIEEGGDPLGIARLQAHFGHSSRLPSLRSD